VTASDDPCAVEDVAVGGDEGERGVGLLNGDGRFEVGDDEGFL